MKHFLATMAAAVATLVAASSVSADPLVGPKVFEFSATCSGIGSVILTNLGPARTEAFQVVGTNTIVLNAFNFAPGILQLAIAAGTSCTYTGGGPPGDIQPFPPFTVPAVIVNG